MGFLEHIRSKPSHVKSHYAFLGALAVTGIVAFVWTTTLPARLSGVRTSLVDNTDTEAAVVKSGFADLLLKMQEGMPTPEEESVDSYDETSVSTETNTALGGLEGWDVATTTSPQEDKETVTPTEPAKSSPETEESPITRGAVIRIGTTTKNTTNAE